MADEPNNTTGQTGQTPAVEQPAWAKELSDTMKSVATGINSLVSMAQDPARRSAQTPPPAPEPEPDTGEDLLDDQSLEVLPRKAFAERIVDTFESRLEAALKPITDQISQTAQAAQAADFKQDAIRFADRTEDFGEWEKEMMALAEENPNLSIPRIYRLARAEAPAKALEMDKKYGLNGQAKPGATPTPPPAQPGRKRVAPLSLTPASGSAEVVNHRMKPDEAAQDAWDKAVAQFGNPFDEAAT